MKKQNLMMVALVAMTAGLSMNVMADQQPAAAATAPKAQTAPAATAAPVSSKLSADEQAFSAKLSEQNRKAFEQFTADQRKVAMTSCAGGSCGKAALNPNDAVQKVVKDQVAVAEKPAAATQAK